MSDNAGCVVVVEGFSPNSAPTGPCFAVTQEPPAAAPRRYLPTLSDLIDRMSIVQMKVIFIPEARDAHKAELDDILHDVDLLLAERTTPVNAEDIRAIMLLMLSNRVIWENESKARAGGNQQDHLLKFTHSINGVRNRAKNYIASRTSDRLDWKVDCFAADLPAEFGQWDVF